MLPTQAYLQITGMYDFKGGAALSFLLLIPALAVYALQNFWVSRKSFVTVSGKAGGRSSIKGPGVLISSIVIGTVAFITAFVLYLYAIILVGSVVKVWGVDNSLTFENYHYVFTFGMKAIKDTLLIACIGTPLGGLLAVLIGYVCKWLKIRGHKTLETVSLLNYTLPGTVVGIAYIIAFNDQPLVLLTLSALIICGGLGFVVWQDLWNYRKRRQLDRHDVPCHGHCLRYPHAAGARYQRHVYQAKTQLA